MAVEAAFAPRRFEGRLPFCAGTMLAARTRSESPRAPHSPGRCRKQPIGLFASGFPLAPAQSGGFVMQPKPLSNRFASGSGCQKNAGERERAATLSRFHRSRRHVCVSLQFCFVAQRREQKLERGRQEAQSCGFCGFAKGETATAQIENLSRDTRRGRCSPSANLSKIRF